MIEVDRFFAENPRLKPLFYGNIAIEPSDRDYDQVVSVAEMLVDHWDLVRVLQEATRTSFEQPWTGNRSYRLPWEGWKEYFIARYDSSPAIRRFWAENRELYSPELRDILDPLCNEYAQTSDG